MLEFGHLFIQEAEQETIAIVVYQFSQCLIDRYTANNTNILKSTGCRLAKVANISGQS